MTMTTRRQWLLLIGVVVFFVLPAGLAFSIGPMELLLWWLLVVVWLAVFIFWGGRQSQPK